MKRNRLKELTQKKLWLAPLAGVTDVAFRTICKDCGAEIMVSEMCSADGLLYNRERTLIYAGFDNSHRPFGIQLFGSDPQIISRAAASIIDLKPDFIDINMGCPVKKVIKKGAGAALLRDIPRAKAIITSLKALLSGTGILLSAKIRSGWDRYNIICLDLARELEAAGLDMICLHPRTKNQMYSGVSDWSLITKLTETLTIPVIGNGDIRSWQDAERMLSTTACDSIMIGRGILGKPWLLSEIKARLHNHEFMPFTPQEKLEIIRKHLLLSVRNKGEKMALTEMRTHFSWYTKGFRGGSVVRDFINRSYDTDDILNAIDHLYSNNPEISDYGYIYG
ncbi:MAG: tRNA dihydrouridine synthase DusB [Candidatus Cloacimonetes bacterium]|nr:tRNA dihydrouridine synthase DusB [Candidatus Cloacimonadota bacterium]